MGDSGGYQLLRDIFLAVPVVVCLSGCSGGGSTGKIHESVQDTGNELILFDGKTLSGWEVTNFGPQGPVYVSGGKIILSMGDGCTGITWKNDFPAEDYELTLDAMRLDGNDFFCGVTFPVGDSYCSLIIGGWGGSVVGISCIDGMDASENSTTRIMNFSENTWYAIRVKVTGKKINAWLNDGIIVDFETDGHKLSVRPEVELSKPFGIASWQTTAALRNIRLKLLNDEH